MKKGLVYLLVLFALPVCAQTAENAVSGKVTDVWETPIRDVNILVKGSTQGTQTDAMGQFELQAISGEVLVFSAIGYGTLELTVPENPSSLNVVLSPQTTRLSGVTVKKRKRKRQQDLLADYDENPRLIKTSFGILDKDRSSGSMQIIDGERLLTIGPDFLTSLKNHVPGMRVVRPPVTPQVEVYMNRMSYSQDSSGTQNTAPRALFDVDGIILETAPTYLISHNIDRVAVLQRNSAISRYGPRGIGGVIIINTKGQNQMDGRGIVRNYDNSTMQDSLSNLFTEKKSYVPNTPYYMEAFGSATSLPKARELLNESKEHFTDEPHFFLDLAYYFRGRWNDDKNADMLLAEVLQKFPNNVPALRSLAYRYESLSRHDQALEVFQKVLKQDSLTPQSYGDVANAFAALGNREKAAELYTNYEKIRNQLKASESPRANTFMLIESENTKRPLNVPLDVENLGNTTGNKITPTRIVASWSNPNTQLGMQIVSPESLLQIWEASESQKNDGVVKFNTSQFFVEEEPKGEWQLNLRHFEGDPTYLRIMVYFDYGLPSQKTKIRLFKLTPNYRGNHLLALDTQKRTIGE
ncbi:tetratricopeptide repeat protein [Flagellimonas myxillae]|uniref:tetratricopeptide repeat protein n=1 Tax=Flagellimonas myxillae TaxID=2942214 RepID=UPI00201F3906|nr:tetratricopeptide repeat protein [Muricauda myxillae]MCL6265443.1 carboxypeptidase-like regulatory domain-containing protein [Muricauda myxillae]